VYTAPRKLEYQDWPKPEPDVGEALVQVKAAAVCGSDLHGWLGHSRGRVPPLVLGHEAAGIVAELRASGTAVKVGDRVVIFPMIGCGQCQSCAAGQDNLCRRRRVLGLHVAGAFAEYVKVPARNLYPLPPAVDFSAATLVEPLGCALRMVGKAGSVGGPIAILGAGPIGLLTLLAARCANFARVAVVELNRHRAAFARQLGADFIVNPHDADHLEQLHRFFGKDGCWAVFDAAGFAAARQLAVKLARVGGLIVLSGLGEPETTMDFVEIVRREIRLEGTFASDRGEFQKAIDLIRAGQLQASLWITQASLADGQTVFQDLIQPTSHKIKVAFML